MNGFRKLQKRLREEGWYVGWNHYCCQSCAWMDVPTYLDEEYDEKGYVTKHGPEVDLNKVLFNHSQDCEFNVYEDHYTCQECDGDGYSEDDECTSCEGRGFIVPDEDKHGLLEEGSFICYPPEMQDESLFCFSSSDQGVQNLIDILPIIEECGCKWYWDKTGKSRIEISWDLE